MLLDRPQEIEIRAQEVRFACRQLSTAGRLQPGAPRLAKQIAPAPGLTAQLRVPINQGVDAVLHHRGQPYQEHPLPQPAPVLPRHRTWHVGGRDQIGSQQMGQHPRVNAVGLHLGFRDHSHFGRVSQRHLLHQLL